METTITIRTDTFSETEADKQAHLYELGRYLGEGALHLAGSKASHAQAQNLTINVKKEAQPYFA